MKTGAIIAVFGVLLVGVVVWGEVRVSRLENEIAALKDSPPAKAASKVKSSSSTQRAGRILPASSKPSSKSGRVVQNEGAEGAGQGEQPGAEDALGDVFRKMMESDAGKAMARMQNRNRAGRIYGPLVEELNLSEDETKYFYEVVGEGAGAEDQLWMKLMGAKTDAEKQQIVADYEAAAAARQSAVKDFLNDDGDFETYANYESRRGEYEQLPAIREVLEGAGLPLNADQEAGVVEAMYQARVQSGISQRWEGAAVVDQISQPGMVDRFNTDWDGFQQALDAPINNVLQPEQREVFNQQQDSLKQMVTFGLRMAESGANLGGVTPEGSGGVEE